MRHLLAVVLAPLSACVHPVVASAPAPVRPTIAIPGSELAFYELTGANPVDVVQSLVEESPADGNVQHAAQTRWEVVWRYPAGPEDQPEACDLSSVEVHVSVVTDFPRWEPPATASAVDVAEWYRYTEALAGHEASHVQLIDDLAGTIPAVLGRTDCAHADAEGARVLDAIRTANAELDTLTRNGAAEGAALAWLGG